MPWTKMQHRLRITWCPLIIVCAQVYQAFGDCSYMVMVRKRRATLNSTCSFPAETSEPSDMWPLFTFAIYRTMGPCNYPANMKAPHPLLHCTSIQLFLGCEYASGNLCRHCKRPMGAILNSVTALPASQIHERTVIRQINKQASELASLERNPKPIWKNRNREERPIIRVIT